MISILKNKPWKNLMDTMTSHTPFPLLILFIFYFLLMPYLVISAHVFDADNSMFQFLPDVLSIIIVFFIPKYLRTRRNLLSLQKSYDKGLFSFFYRSLLKIGGAFAVVFVAYVSILFCLIIIQLLTGFTRTQEIPDLSHLTLPVILFRAFSAGLTEEVWRVVGIILILTTIKHVVGIHWNAIAIKAMSLFFAVLFTSFIFGWLHTFGYSDSLFSVPITTQIGVMGIVLSSIFLSTRRIWCAIFFHFVFDLVSLTANARGLANEEAFSAFLASEKTLIMFWLIVSVASVSILLSLYLLRFSRGAKKKMLQT